jgi:four helix bundle protein
MRARTELHSAGCDRDEMVGRLVVADVPCFVLFNKDFDAWAATVPRAITTDPLWRTPAYRYALFLSDAARDDARRLRGDSQARLFTDQLLRAVGSISANLAEGYSRVDGPDRARFYQYAFGSAREARDWYFKCRHALGEETASDRLECLSRIARILAVAIPQERARKVTRTDRST